MRFLEINLYTLAMDSGKFIALSRLLNSTSIILDKEWARQLYYKARSFGYKITLHTPHNGYTYHIHFSGNNGKLDKLHVQITKSAWDFLKNLIK